MRATEESSEARLDALRKRLYRADATEEDRQRYEEVLAEAPSQEAPRPEPTPRPRRRLALGIAAGVVVLGALAVAIRFDLPAPTTVLPTAQPSATSTPFFPGLSSGVVDIGDGDLLPIGAQTPAGPTSVAASIDGMAVAGQRFEGYGNAVVAFDPPTGAWDGGRLSIAVTSTQPARVAWRSLLTVTRTDWTSYPLVLASGTAEDRSGAHAPTVFVYPSRPPTKVAIEAPEGVGWTLVVAATGAKAGILH